MFFHIIKLNLQKKTDLKSRNKEMYVDKIRTRDSSRSVARRSIQLSYTYFLNTFVFSAGDRGSNPIRVVLARRILSPGRLPVPPHRLGVLLIIAIIMIAATRMGFEPTTSAVTGRRSNQLSHRAIMNTYQVCKWTFGDSNPGPTGYEPVALTN